MVVRVPLLGMVLAVALLVGENLGANAYVAAKQREADRQADVDAARARQDALVQQLIEEIQRRDQEIKRIRQDLLWKWSPTGPHELERIRGELETRRVEIARLRLEAEKLRAREH